MSEADQCKAVKNYVNGYERTKMMNSLTKAMNELANTDDDPNHFVPLSKMRVEVVSMLGPFMKEITDLYQKTKTCETRINEFVHMVNTLTTEQKRYSAGLDQFNHFRRDIAEQEAQTKKTNERIAEVDAKLAMTRVEIEDHFAENQKRELAHTALVEGYERRCKVMQGDLEYNFKS